MRTRMTEQEILQKKLEEVEKACGVKTKLKMVPFDPMMELLNPEEYFLGNMNYEEGTKTIQYSPGMLNFAPLDAIGGGIAHELAHFVLKHKHKGCELECQKDKEDEADKWAVFHGFGRQMVAFHKTYIIKYGSEITDINDDDPTSDHHSIMTRIKNTEEWIKEYESKGGRK